ncbi:MAG: OsmC family protein [Terracidiphilus sp.]|jgi:putative redox protein
MIAHSEWKHDRVFDGISQSGHTVQFDASPAHTEGPSPMEAVLMGLCGCTSADVVSILQKKRQELTGLRVTAKAEQAVGPPQVFTRILLTYAVRGRLSRKAVEDAVALSKDKYCSVSQMLDKTATIEYEIVYPDGEPEP